jgi:hypothetical protein
MHSLAILCAWRFLRLALSASVALSASGAFCLGAFCVALSASGEVLSEMTDQPRNIIEALAQGRQRDGNTFRGSRCRCGSGPSEPLAVCVR